MSLRGRMWERWLTLISGLLLVLGFVLLLVPNFSAPYSQSLSIATVRADADGVPSATFGAFGACMPFFAFYSSAGVDEEARCTEAHDGYTFVAFLTHVIRDALGENSGLVEVQTIPVVLLGREDTQGLMLFAVCVAVGGLGAMVFAFGSWRKKKWTRVASLVLICIAAVLGWVAFGLAWGIPGILRDRLETYNQAEQRRWTLIVERGNATHLALVGSIVWSIALLLAIIDMCLEPRRTAAAVRRREEAMTIELRQKAEDEEGMSYEAKAQKYLPVNNT